MDTIEYVDRLQDHWWWREGRHFYACHITIDDQPELQRLVGASGVCPPRLPASVGEDFQYVFKAALTGRTRSPGARRLPRRSRYFP